MAQVSSALRDEISRDPTIINDYIHPHSLNNGIPTEEIPAPKIGGEFPVDEAVLQGILTSSAAGLSQWLLMLSSTSDQRYTAAISVPLWLVSVGYNCKAHHKATRWND
jgi:hypothetical protein